MTSVTVAQGKLRGGEAKSPNGFSYYEFLEVPYAKPPVGDLRFKSPQDPNNWEGERDASVYHSDKISCQYDLYLRNSVIGSEDCLYLNIFVPKEKTTSALLPVLVYIHGGGFIYGSGTIKDENGPDFLVEKDVIVIMINYRLGVLGFLSLDIPEAAGNMGLKDQVKALQWIQNNIKHFGGDKNNVTIFGVSAGSASIEYLILSPLAKGLFHKAILNSGSSLNNWAISFEYKQLLCLLLEELNYKGSKENTKAVHEFLLKITAHNLTEAGAKVIASFTDKRMFFGFVPIIEKDFGNGDTFLSELPYTLLKEGRFNNVPVIRGFCEQEGSIMTALQPNAVKELLQKKDFAKHWSYEFVGADKDKYNKKLSSVYSDIVKPNSESDQFAIDFLGDLQFSAGIALSGKWTSHKNAPTYMYIFSYDGNLNVVKAKFGMEKKGATHGDDLMYLFYNTKLDSVKCTKSDILVRNMITSMWTNFAKTGNPTPRKTEDIPIQWPVHTKESPMYLIIDADLTIKFDYSPKKLAVFEEIYDKYQK